MKKIHEYNYNLKIYKFIPIRIINDCTYVYINEKIHLCQQYYKLKVNILFINIYI
jgi:hypothetical protein